MAPAAVVMFSHYGNQGGFRVRTATTLRSLFLGIAVLLASTSAQADIKSFNASVKARDFKAAAADAVATWPTLDKSRADIAIIAREFGFTALVAKDFAAAKTFGEAAVAASATLSESADLRATSDVLRDVANHKLSPSPATRDQLVRSLEARVGQGGIDLISYFAADVATAYDFERGAWAEAQASASLSRKLSQQGGDLYQVYAFRFDLFANVAEYMRTRDAKVYAQLVTLRRETIAAIDAAPSDAGADPIADFYWEVEAWRPSIGQHLVSRRKMKWPDSPEVNPYRTEDRSTRLLGFRAADAGCESIIEMRRDIRYPSSALFKGLIGVVMLRVDIDAQGAASNPEIVTAVPDKYFGEAVLRSVKDIRYKPGEKWGAECTLVQPGRVITFEFTVGG